MAYTTFELKTLLAPKFQARNDVKYPKIKMRHIHFLYIIFVIRLAELIQGVEIVVHPQQPSDREACQNTETLLKQAFPHSGVKTYYSHVRQVTQLWYM